MGTAHHLLNPALKRRASQCISAAVLFYIGLGLCTDADAQHCGQIDSIGALIEASSFASDAKLPQIRYVEVVRGDTISDLARRHTISVDQLLALNHLSASGLQLKIGQILLLPDC